MQSNDNTTLLAVGAAAAVGLYLFSKSDTPEIPMPAATAATPTSSIAAGEPAPTTAAPPTITPPSNVTPVRRPLQPVQTPWWEVLQRQVTSPPPTYKPDARGLPLQYYLLQLSGGVNELTADEWNYYLARVQGKSDQPDPTTFLPQDVGRDFKMPVAMFVQLRGLGAMPRGAFGPKSTIDLYYSRNGWGMGDVLTDAQSKLQAAGYSNVTCRTERVYLPMPDPGTGLNYYDQNICSTPGFIGAFDADVVSQQSTAAHPGYGVDLAAERAYNLAMGAGSGPSYIEAFGSTPATQVLRSVSPSGQATQSAPNAQAAQTYMQTLQSRAPAPVQTAPAIGPASTLQPGGGAAQGAPATDHTDWFKEPVVLIGLAAVAVVAVMSMSKSA